MCITSLHPVSEDDLNLWPSTSASQDCRHVPPILFYMVLGTGPRAACMLAACSINRATLPVLNSIHFSPLSSCLLELFPGCFVFIPSFGPLPPSSLLERLRENQTAAGTEEKLQFPPTWTLIPGWLLRIRRLGFCVRNWICFQGIHFCPVTTEQLLNASVPNERAQVLASSGCALMVKFWAAGCKQKW